MAKRNSSKIFLLFFLPLLTCAQDLKIGIIGVDTSHAEAFTHLLKDTPGARVVAAFPGGSPDLPASADRMPRFVAALRDKFGVEMVSSIPALLERVDAVLLLSVDGRKHLEQIRPVLAARKPVFIDKPLAASLKDAREIFRLCAESKNPCFSSSSLRFQGFVQALKGDVQGLDVYAPATLEPHHPDLYWYGIHGVEILYTVMGPGCRSVQRTFTEEQEVVVAQWKDGRIATLRGLRKGKTDYGATVYGSKEIRRSSPVKDAPYRALVDEIVRFFRTGVPPVKPEETLEMFAFMDAAQLSRERGGARVELSDIK